MDFDKNKAIELAKNLANKFDPKELQSFLEKHPNLDFIEDVKILFAIIKDSIKGDYKVDTKTYLVIAGALAYLVIPTDLIPDFIPGVGFIDDAFVIGWTITTLKEEIESYKKAKGEKAREIK